MAKTIKFVLLHHQDGALTFGILTLSIITHGITALSMVIKHDLITLSIMNISVTTQGIMTWYIVSRHNGIQHNDYSTMVLSITTVIKMNRA